jgi:hypothetical protein
MSDADDLVAFVKRCLDKDEQVARAAQALECDVFDGTGIVVMHATTGTRSVTLPSTVANHIARWDPARVLAEVEAKRRILDDYDIVVSAIRRVDDVEGNRLLYARLEARESDIRWLAQPYAGHEGWREEWVAQP